MVKQKSIKPFENDNDTEISLSTYFCMFGTYTVLFGTFVPHNIYSQLIFRTAMNGDILNHKIINYPDEISQMLLSLL